MAAVVSAGSASDDKCHFHEDTVVEHASKKN